LASLLGNRLERSISPICGGRFWDSNAVRGFVGLHLRKGVGFLLIVPRRWPLAVVVTQTQSTHPLTLPPAQAGATPLLLEKNEGETRLWRPEPGEVDPAGFILKVTPKANGSQHLVLVTEDMPQELQSQPTNIWSRMKL
jgi:hypothetical protein